jgi:peroxiredoxin 5
LIEGSQIPDVTLFEDNPGNLVKIRDLFAGKKGLLIGVPGFVLSILFRIY